MFLFSLGQTQSPLEKYLGKWLKHPESDLGIVFSDYIHHYESEITLTNVKECELPNAGFLHLSEQITTPLTNPNLDFLTILKNKKMYRYMII